MRNTQHQHQGPMGGLPMGDDLLSAVSSFPSQKAGVVCVVASGYTLHPPVGGGWMEAKPRAGWPMADGACLPHARWLCNVMWPLPRSCSCSNARILAGSLHHLHLPFLHNAVCIRWTPGRALGGRLALLALSPCPLFPYHLPAINPLRMSCVLSRVTTPPSPPSYLRPAANTSHQSPVSSSSSSR
jgi:hypothetical protein